jgi:hypothetical protein
MVPLQGLSFWESSPPMGPSESPTRHRKNQADAPTETPGLAAAAADVSAERVRTEVSSTASAAAVLQRAVPGGGAEVVAVESSTPVPGNSGGSKETEWAKPALPGARPERETGRARDS